ncbi:serpentine type 7TM GPCR receptor class ab chemoreceptor domain-containing protein [Ditylenchus destructor]|uniref:Serpentine type 7TM GPCR receptor class ab chemoreceptor domain-containing protein n=1 Tax=Ditylenchus destructor TaxID=166010 RepID=A0AAD4MRF1_9BILA|nr:serpentine type 7TM GPCR receptor class ab chemoreceptor domain-containing protein [Ditylenchus destructor]
MANDSESNSLIGLCATAKALRFHAAVIFSEIVQIILALVTLILLLAAILSYKKYRISLHPNLMLLFANLIFLYAYQYIFIVIVQGRHQLLVYFSSNPCDLLTPAWLSVVLRVPGYVYVRAFIFSHFALATERARATIFARHYEKEGASYPLICIVIIWILTTLETSYVVVQALRDPTFWQPLVQVSLTAETNATFQIYMNFFGLALLIITAIMDYLLLVENRKKRLTNTDYSLSRTFQINENINVMNFIWPVDVSYAVVFSIYLAGSTFIRLISNTIAYAQYVAISNILYTVLSMHSIVTLLLYLRFVRKSRAKVTAVIVEPNDPTRTYFEQLTSQWNINLKGND